jgi:glycerophosphoryl diester phosphodiesterase
VLVAFLAVPGAGVAAAAARNPDPPALVISHRGASADAPEHTFAAYDRAVEQHTDVLECDLQLTADGVLVCMHDTTVDRTTGGAATGRVDHFTLAQLRAMDFGAWFGPEFAGASIVPFEEQLRCYTKEAPGVQFYAETKSPAEYGGRMEPALVRLLRRLDLVPKGSPDVHSAPVIIQSFDPVSLATVKRLAPSLPAALLWVAPPGPGTPASIDVMAPSADYLVAHPEAIDEIHATGREVHTWTVDDPAEMDRLLEAGVDGIFSNHTATLRARVDARTGHRPRPAVHIAPGCPGVAGTVTAASDDVSTTTRTTGAGGAVGGDDVKVETDSSSWLPPVVALVAVAGAVAALGVYLARRRR